jgi:uncharacterized membrane protein YfcA
MILIYVCAVAFLAGLIQGFSGFGSVLLALPLLALFLDMRTVVPLVSLYGLFLTVVLFIQLRTSVRWDTVRVLVAGSLPGVPAGVFLLKVVQAFVIEGLAGVILIFFSLVRLFLKSSGELTGKRWGVLFGFLGGCLGGAIGASGPPVIVYTAIQPWDKDAIKSTLQAFFLFSGILVVLFQAVSGLVTAPVLRFFAAGFPFLMAGTFTGSFFYGSVRTEGYQKILFVLLVLLGGFMAAKAFMVDISP